MGASFLGLSTAYVRPSVDMFVLTMPWPHQSTCRRLSLSIVLLPLGESVSIDTRKLFWRKDDRAMRPVYGSPENFRDSLTVRPRLLFPFAPPPPKIREKVLFFGQLLCNIGAFC